MTNQHQITPPDDLIDQWGDLQIPWTQKAKLIAAWGAHATDQTPVQELEIPFSILIEWEALLHKGVAMAFWQAANWGYQKGFEQASTSESD